MDNAFINHVKEQGQTITYCGVNDHQNGKAEKLICDLQERTSIMILYATHRRPDTIAPHIWPYALKMANEIWNITPRLQDGQVPLALFAQTIQSQ